MITRKDLTIVLYDENLHHKALQTFCNEAEIDGVTNNASIEALAFKKDTALFLVMLNDRIISLSYVHDFNEYYPDAYRAFTRTATLKEFRGQGFPKTKTCISGAGLQTYVLPYQVDYAFSKGAKTILFTTNTDNGDKNSSRLGAFLLKIADSEPRITLIDKTIIYGVEQLVWRVNFRDFIAMNEPI